MSEVLYSSGGGVGALVINRPDRRNALDSAVLALLRARLREAVDDPGVRVITLTGTGDRVFCAGADLKASAPRVDEPGRHFGRGDFHQLLLELYGCPKPTVALARGHVLAGGMGLVLACDLALACDDVHFSTPEVHVGMFPMMVMALLFRCVGRRTGIELLLLGERLSAREARDCGIVNRIFPRTSFEAAVAEYVAQLAAKSGEILRRGKAAMRAVEGLTLAEQLDHLEDALARLMATDDSREGIRAFVEKRAPLWKNS